MQSRSLDASGDVLSALVRYARRARTVRGSNAYFLRSKKGGYRAISIGAVRRVDFNYENEPRQTTKGMGRNPD
jgi:hypothetical protein